MNFHYLNTLRRGMPKSLPKQQEVYDAIVQALMVIGFVFGVLMVVVQLFR